MFSWQNWHILASIGVLECLPTSICSLWSLSRSLLIAFRWLKLIVVLIYFSISTSDLYMSYFRNLLAVPDLILSLKISLWALWRYWSRRHLCIFSKFISWFSCQTRHWSNAVLMLGQSLRRWPNIEPTLNKCTMFERKSSCRTANTRHLYNIYTTSPQRFRRWSNIAWSHTSVLCLLSVNTSFWGQAVSKSQQ